jgi:modification methylase
MNGIDHLLGKIHVGDCLKFMQSLPDKCVDLVVTSPPYNMGQFTRNGGANVYENYSGNDMEENDYREWIWKIIYQIERITRGYWAFNIKYRYKNNRCILPHWVLDKTTTNLRNEIIWKYGYYVDVNNDKFYPGHEHIFISSKNSETKIDHHELSKLGDVWEIPAARIVDGIGGKIHPAPFPSIIPQRIIEAVTVSDGVVFDPFMGSGTSAVACERLGRRWFGCEISEAYCSIAQKRIDAERAQFKLPF